MNKMRLDNDEFLSIAEKKGAIVKCIKELCGNEEYGVFAWMIIKETPLKIVFEIRFCGDFGYKSKRRKLACDIVGVVDLSWVVSMVASPEEGNPLIVTIEGEEESN